MIHLLAEELSLSGGVTAALIALSVVVLVLDVLCIIDIVRRPTVLGGQKWVWILVVLLFNLIGAIIYLAVGRTHPPAADARSAAAPTCERAATAADLLYGPPVPSQPEAPAPQSPAAAGSAQSEPATSEPPVPNGEAIRPPEPPRFT